MRDKPTPKPEGATIHHVMTEVQRANGKLERLEMTLEKIEKALQQISEDVSVLRAREEQ